MSRFVRPLLIAILAFSLDAGAGICPIWVNSPEVPHEELRRVFADENIDRFFSWEGFSSANQEFFKAALKKSRESGVFLEKAYSLSRVSGKIEFKSGNLSMKIATEQQGSKVLLLLDEVNIATDKLKFGDIQTEDTTGFSNLMAMLAGSLLFRKQLNPAIESFDVRAENVLNPRLLETLLRFGFFIDRPPVMKHLNPFRIMNLMFEIRSPMGAGLTERARAIISHSGRADEFADWNLGIIQNEMQLDILKYAVIEARNLKQIRNNISQVSNRHQVKAFAQATLRRRMDEKLFDSILRIQSSSDYAGFLVYLKSRI